MPNQPDVKLSQIVPATSPPALTDSVVGVLLSGSLDRLFTLQQVQSAIGSGSGIGVNVKDFGAIGSGLVDDGPAIQAAIDYAVTNNYGTIIVPIGSYAYNFPLFLDHPTAGMRGDPPPAAWAVGTTYAINTLVTFGGVPFKSLANGNVGNTPHMNTSGTFPDTHWVFAPQQGNTFAMSLRLLGDNAAGSYDNRGATLFPLYTDAAALLIGPGQGMQISHVNILGPNPPKASHRCLRNLKSSGISIASGGGGVTRTMIDHCAISGFYTGVGNALGDIPLNGLGDSTTLYKVAINDVHTAVYFGSTQNYVNSLYDCTFSNIHWAVWTMQGTGCNIYGGNLSPVFTTTDTLTPVTISNVRLGTAYPPNNIYEFDAVLNPAAFSPTGNYTRGGLATQFAVSGGLLYYSPGGGINLPTPPSGDWVGAENVLGFTNTINGTDSGIFNFFLVTTVHFGNVPCECTAYNPATRVATFSTKWWHVFGDLCTGDLTGNSDIAAELAAATSIMCVEVPTLFKGVGINVHSSFTEMTSAGPCGIIDSETFFSGGKISIIDGMFSDSDMSCYSDAINVPNFDTPLFLSCQHWPAYAVNNGPVTIRGFTSFTGGPVASWINNRFKLEDCPSPGAINPQIVSDGFYEFDVNPTLSNFGPVLADSLWTINNADGFVYRTGGDDINPLENHVNSISLEQSRGLIRLTQGLAPIVSLGGGNWAVANYSENGGAHLGNYPLLQGQKSYPIRIDSTPYAEDATSYHAPQERIYVVSGLTGAGNITATGTFWGQIVVWAMDLTASSDATASFNQSIISDNTITQTSSSNLSSHTFQICVRTPQFVRSSHFGFSWGQNLDSTIIPGLAWTYKTASAALYLTATNPADAYNFFVPGMRIILTLGGSDFLFRLMHNHFREGYVTVYSGSTNPGTGTTTVYTGTTIKQQPYQLSFS